MNICVADRLAFAFRRPPVKIFLDLDDKPLPDDICKLFQLLFTDDLEIIEKSIIEIDKYAKNETLLYPPEILIRLLEILKSGSCIEHIFSIFNELLSFRSEMGEFLFQNEALPIVTPYLQRPDCLEFISSLIRQSSSAQSFLINNGFVADLLPLVDSTDHLLYKIFLITLDSLVSRPFENEQVEREICEALHKCFTRMGTIDLETDNLLSFCFHDFLVFSTMFLNMFIELDFINPFLRQPPLVTNVFLHESLRIIDIIAKEVPQYLVEKNIVDFLDKCLYNAEKDDFALVFRIFYSILKRVDIIDPIMDASIYQLGIDLLESQAKVRVKRNVITFLAVLFQHLNTEGKLLLISCRFIRVLVDNIGIVEDHIKQFLRAILSIPADSCDLSREIEYMRQSEDLENWIEPLTEEEDEIGELACCFEQRIYLDQPQDE